MASTLNLIFSFCMLATVMGTIGYLITKEQAERYHPDGGGWGHYLKCIGASAGYGILTIVFILAVYLFFSAVGMAIESFGDTASSCYK